MRLNNYLEFKNIGNTLKIFRVHDGKIDEITKKEEIKAIENIIKFNSVKPISHRDNSVFYGDLCSIYKEQFERYCNLYGTSTKYETSTKPKKNVVTSKNNTVNSNSSKKNTSNKSNIGKQIPKGKKINRKKSREVKRFIIRMALLSSLGFVGFNGVKGVKNILTDSGKASNSISYNDDRELKRSNVDLGFDNVNNAVSDNDDYDDTFINVSNSSDVNDDINIEDLEFDYEYSDIGDKEALENAYQYNYYFDLYGNMYGIEPKLLALIAAQESSGVHKEYSENGFATGLMGIENVWSGETVRAYNYQTQEMEQMTIDYDRIGSDVDYNIKVGAMIFQQKFNAAVKNRGDLFSKNELLAYAIQKYNLGSGNSARLFKIGDGDWISNRDFIDAGDSRYFEHVLSRLDNGDTINLMYYNEDTGKITIYSTTVYNYDLEKGISK